VERKESKFVFGVCKFVESKFVFGVCKFVESKFVRLRRSLLDRAAEEMVLLHLIPSSSSSVPFKPKLCIDLLETQFFAKKTQLPASVLGLVTL
jgi:hypothetical protein